MTIDDKIRDEKLHMKLTENCHEVKLINMNNLKAKEYNLRSKSNDTIG